jgi:hypothetical protein
LIWLFSFAKTFDMNILCFESCKELVKVPRPDLMMREARCHTLSTEELEQKFGISNTPYLKYGPAGGNSLAGRKEVNL